MKYVEITDSIRIGITKYADWYAMTLFEGDRKIARGEGFRPGAGRDFGAENPDNEFHTVDTFAAFLDHALESSESDARDGWTIYDESAAKRLVSVLYAHAETIREEF